MELVDVAGTILFGVGEVFRRFEEYTPLSF